VEFSGNASAVDSLNYPYQTLYYRGGDCDDLSILYCAMLEALGIDTAFITIPGHIYCAFDVGIPVQDEGEKKGEGWREEGLIEYGRKLWMPVEITAPGEGFYGAWRIGAREWRAAASGSLTTNGSLTANGGPAGETRQIYPMRESWALYPPVTVPEAGDNLPEMPGEAEIARRFGEAMGRFN
jgi:hypothetical protein